METTTTTTTAQDSDMMETEDAPMYGSDDDIDDTPLFVQDGDAVEVQVDDTNVPMDDDDDDTVAPAQDGMTADTPVVDMAKSVISTHADPVYAVACSSNNTTLRLVSGGGDDKAFWHELNMTTAQTQSTPLEAHYPFKDSISAVASNTPFIHFDTTKPPNPDWMAVGGLDGSIVLFGPDSKVQPLEGPSSDIEWLCWHPKGGNVLLAGSSDCTIWMFHTSLNKCLQVFVGHEDAVTCGTFSADGKVALSGSADGTLRIWAPKTGKSKHVFRFHEHGNNGGSVPALTCIATHGGTDQQLIISGGEDGQAHICHVANKKHITSLRHYDPTEKASSAQQQQQQPSNDNDEEMLVPSGVEAVGFCKSNPNWCATGGMDGVLKIWDLANQGQCRHSCKLHNSEEKGDGITQLTWHPTLPLVVTSTTRGQVHVWDARNGQLLQTLTGHTDVINDMDVSFVVPPAGSSAGQAVIVTASDDKTVRIFNVDIDAALAQAAQQVVQQQ